MAQKTQRLPTVVGKMRPKIGLIAYTTGYSISRASQHLRVNLVLRERAPEKGALRTPNYPVLSLEESLVRVLLAVCCWPSQRLMDSCMQ